MIKNIKIGNLVYDTYNEKEINESGQIDWNIPQDLNEFKAIALDTISWRASKHVKKIAVNQDTVNAKAIALLAKIMSPTDEQLAGLSEKERHSWDNMKLLADGGYADSDKLSNTLEAVVTAVQSAGDQSRRIMSAKTIDAVIEILNEEQ